MLGTLGENISYKVKNGENELNVYLWGFKNFYTGYFQDKLFSKLIENGYKLETYKDRAMNSGHDSVTISWKKD